MWLCMSAEFSFYLPLRLQLYHRGRCFAGCTSYADNTMTLGQHLQLDCL